MTSIIINNQVTEFGSDSTKFTNLLNPPLKIKKNRNIRVNNK